MPRAALQALRNRGQPGRGGKSQWRLLACRALPFRRCEIEGSRVVAANNARAALPSPALQGAQGEEQRGGRGATEPRAHPSFRRIHKAPPARFSGHGGGDHRTRSPSPRPFSFVLRTRAATIQVASEGGATDPIDAWAIGLCLPSLLVLAVPVAAYPTYMQAFECRTRCTVSAAGGERRPPRPGAAFTEP